MEEYWASISDDHFGAGPYDTLEEAKEECVNDLALEVEQTVYIGTRKEVEFEVTERDVEDIIDRMKDDVWEQIGEVAEAFLDGVTRDERAQLAERFDEVFKQWLIDTCNEISVFSVVDVKPYKLGPMG